jgi:hypothetical protein
MDSVLNKALNSYEALLTAQLKEVEALRSKGTKAGARRVRMNSLALDKAGKELRKVTVQEIG